jgi:Ser-tRNA(Ala) deacylase AlaX
LSLPATTRLYLQDDRCLDAHAHVVAVHDNAVAFDRICFYPGGGGQPPDAGSVMLESGEAFDTVSAHAGPE